MKKSRIILFTALFCAAGNCVAAQCNDTIYPSPKRFGDPKYWPYGYRPATGCELNFFRSFHKNLVDILSNTPANFASYSKLTWDVRNPDADKGEVDNIAQYDGEGLFYNLALSVEQGTEKSFFKLIHGPTYFEWSLETGINTPEAKKIQEDIFSSAGKPGHEQVDMRFNDLMAKTHIKLTIPNVNIKLDALQEHHAKMEILPFKGPAYIVKITRDKQVKEEGDANVDHLDELHIYIGKWKAPQIFTTAALQELKVQQNFNISNPKLSLQNFVIIIKCDASLFDDLLQNIDFDSLNKLVMQ